ncbi:MAG: hypothetical protein HY777_01915, partial [Betaproteobacteria bacterium]|nr:hypothetical protein [Betaproteobacteria bacterium]
MGTKRKQRGAQFKAQVAMAALSGEKAPAEPASEHGVHPTVIGAREQGLVENAKDLFERGDKKAEDPRKVIGHLHRKIGQLQPGPLKRLDEHFTGNPIYGSRRLQQMPEREGIPAGRRRLRRPMKKPGLW